jgi:hypothetical protein
MKITVITAHPDDLEIACSGTLKFLQDQGADITSVITVKPSAEDNPNRNEIIVSSELERSYAISGFNLKVLDTDLHPNGRPNLVCDNNTIDKLSQLLEPCDLAIIHNPQDSHQDHRTSHDIAWPLVKKLANEVWLLESYPYCFDYQHNTANLYYDITKYWNFKRSLLDCYSSYIGGSGVMSMHNINIANKWWGLKNDSALAEAFTIKQKYVR